MIQIYKCSGGTDTTDSAGDAMARSPLQLFLNLLAKTAALMMSDCCQALKVASKPDATYPSKTTMSNDRLLAAADL